MQRSIVKPSPALKEFSPVLVRLQWATQLPGGCCNMELGPTCRRSDCSDSLVSGGGP